MERNSRGEWITRYARRQNTEAAPSRWVLQRVEYLPRASLVCDVAGGTGRHAAPLAERGHRIVLLDFVESAARQAMQRSAYIAPVVADARALPFKAATFDALLVTNFLDRDLISALIALLKPGGHLLYETYTIDHAALVAAGLAKAPRSARYLLNRGELRSLFASLEILHQQEGEVEDEAGRRACASLHGVVSP